MTETQCPKCEGKGFIPRPSRPKRFYSYGYKYDADFCPCGAYPSMTAASNAADARIRADIEAAGEAVKAERTAARRARAAARRAAAEVAS